MEMGDANVLLRDQMGTVVKCMGMGRREEKFYGHEADFHNCVTL